MMTGTKLQILTMTLVVTLQLATAVSMSPSPQITTKPAKVLDLRCSIPWHLVLRDRWFSIDGLEIKFSRNGSDKNVTLARISATMKDPSRGEALHLMAKTTGLVQATDVLDPRPPNLSILTPIDSTGVYYCDIEYSKSSTSGMKTLTYKVDMNMMIMHKTFVATDVCFSVKLIETDEVKVTWSMIESRSHGADTGIILVERMTKIVDAVAKPRILVSIHQDVVVTNRNLGTILVKLDLPALSNPDGKHLLTLFVEHEQCYPDCVYSCEVGGQRCYDEFSTGRNETTESTTAESTTTEHTTAKNTAVTFDDCILPWVLFIVLVLINVFVALVFRIITYKNRCAHFTLNCCKPVEINTPSNKTSRTDEGPDKNLPEISTQPHNLPHTASKVGQIKRRVDFTGKNPAPARKYRSSNKRESTNGEGSDTTGESEPLVTDKEDITGTSHEQSSTSSKRKQMSPPAIAASKQPNWTAVHSNQTVKNMSEEEHDQSLAKGHCKPDSRHQFPGGSHNGDSTCSSAHTGDIKGKTSESGHSTGPNKNLPEHSLHQAQLHYPLHTASKAGQNVQRVDSTGNLAQARTDLLSNKRESTNSDGGDTTGEEEPLLIDEKDVTGTAHGTQPVAKDQHNPNQSRRQYENQGARPKKFPGGSHKGDSSSAHSGDIRDQPSISGHLTVTDRRQRGMSKGSAKHSPRLSPQAGNERKVEPSDSDADTPNTNPSVEGTQYFSPISNTLVTVRTHEINTNIPDRDVHEAVNMKARLEIGERHSDTDSTTTM